MSNFDQRSIETVKKGAELEYNALRTELLKRIELRQNLVSITLTLAGALLGFGLSNPPVALVFPPLVFCLSLLWANNDIRVKQVGKYLQGMEKLIPGLGWETYYRQDRRSQTVLVGISLSALAPSGTFLITEFLAIGVGISTFSYRSIEWTLLVTDIVFILMTIVLLGYVRRQDRYYRL